MEHSVGKSGGNGQGLGKHEMNYSKNAGQIQEFWVFLANKSNAYHHLVDHVREVNSCVVCKRDIGFT